uniref:Ig-like domain-containing protein n=1 Tax=Oryzias latipes TaxID=8090 RepID=A0A3B3HLV2_ORYLA
MENRINSKRTCGKKNFSLSFLTRTSFRVLLYSLFNTLLSKTHRLSMQDKNNDKENARDRTKIVGDLSERNCSLEIDDIKPSDNGPFCFHAERGNEKYTFNNSCVFILTVQIISPIQAEVDAGSALTVSCSVTHTCPSHSPEFSWSVPHISSAVSDSLISGVAPGDGVKNLTCTASFWGEKKGVTTVTLTSQSECYYLILSSVTASGLLCVFLCVCVYPLQRPTPPHRLTSPPAGDDCCFLLSSNLFQ